MTIPEWVHERERRLNLVFTIREVKDAFSAKSEQDIKNNLYRLHRSTRIEAVHRGVYVIVPVKYENRGGVPPSFYMDSLMKALGRNYYFGLLSAARMWGASHQLSMIETVVTTLPNMSASCKRNAHVTWCYRERIPEPFVLEIKGEYDPVRYSSAELTALDLIQYAQFAGGFSRVASVLAELSESMDFSSAAESGLLDSATIPTVQRLGHLLENVIGAKELSDVLYGAFETRFHRQHKYVPLDRSKDTIGASRDARWRIIANQHIELDDL